MYYKNIQLLQCHRIEIGTNSGRTSKLHHTVPENEFQTLVKQIKTDYHQSIHTIAQAVNNGFHWLNDLEMRQVGRYFLLYLPILLPKYF